MMINRRDLTFSNRPTKIYLHRKGQFLDFNGRMGHKVDLGQRMRMQVSYQDIRTINKVRARSMICEHLMAVQTSMREKIYHEV